MAPIAARRDGSWGSRRASAHSRRERSSTSGDDFICRRFVKCGELHSLKGENDRTDRGVDEKV